MITTGYLMMYFNIFNAVVQFAATILIILCAVKYLRSR